MKAIGKYITVKMQESESSSDSGIVFRDTSLVTLGRILSVGSEVETLKVDDLIVLNWGNAMPIKISNTENFHIVHADHVYAVK